MSHKQTLSEGTNPPFKMERLPEVINLAWIRGEIENIRYHPEEDRWSFQLVNEGKS